MPLLPNKGGGQTSLCSFFTIASLSHFNHIKNQIVNPPNIYILYVLACNLFYIAQWSEVVGLEGAKGQYVQVVSYDAKAG